MDGNRTSGTGLGWGRLVAALALLLLGFATAAIAGAAGSGAAQTAVGETGLAAILDRLHDALAALDTHVDGVGWTGLVQQLQEIRTLLESLLEELGTPPANAADRPAIQGDVTRLDALLHRLLDALDHFADGAASGGRPSPARDEAKQAIGALRSYVDGYLDGASLALGPSQRADLERAARRLLDEIAARIAARPTAQAKPQDPRLEAVIKEIQDLVDRLDQFIRRAFGPSTTSEPTTTP